jgi:hypothetical protein
MKEYLGARDAPNLSAPAIIKAYLACALGAQVPKYLQSIFVAPRAKYPSKSTAIKTMPITRKAGGR